MTKHETVLTDEEIDALWIATPYDEDGNDFVSFARAIEQAVLAKQAAQVEPVAWEGGEGWESLAWALCAEENGEDACNELIWEGGPIPEPWGDRWLKYEPEAKRLIALVRKHTTPPATSALVEAVKAAREWAKGDPWRFDRPEDWKRYVTQLDDALRAAIEAEKKGQV